MKDFQHMYTTICFNENTFRRTTLHLTHFTSHKINPLHLGLLLHFGSYNSFEDLMLNTFQTCHISYATLPAKQPCFMRALIVQERFDREGAGVIDNSPCGCVPIGWATCSALLWWYGMVPIRSDFRVHVVDWNPAVAVISWMRYTCACSCRE